MKKNETKKIKKKIHRHIHTYYFLPLNYYELLFLLCIEKLFYIIKNEFPK